MARLYLVDGYNYLYRTGRLPSGRVLAELRSQLAHHLAALCGPPGDTVRIVWDTRRLDVPVLEVETYRRGVRGEFARGQSADDRIVEIVDHARDPGRYVVVSDDSGVCARARRRGARTVSVGEIERRIRVHAPTEPEKPDGPLAPEEVEAWLRLFEDGPSGPQGRG
ncbi:MAG: hypothetical protein D6776_09245 [Planctomycetota bacterium]|nr:MAG: hypothetical protein D6776_09245 [Planctomycetota bacterium]